MKRSERKNLLSLYGSIAAQQYYAHRAGKRAAVEVVYDKGYKLGVERVIRELGIAREEYEQAEREWRDILKPTYERTDQAAPILSEDSELEVS